MKHIISTSSRTAIKRSTRGIGDMIMMEPVIRLLNQKFKQPIDLFLHNDVLTVHQNHPAVGSIFHVDELNEDDYDQIFDLSSSCLEYEQNAMPDIQKTRTEIWCESCDLKCNTSPLLYITEKEIVFGEEYLKSFTRPIVAVGYKSLEPYRNYPHMDHLIRELVKTYDVVVIDKTPPKSLDNIISNKKYSQSIRMTDNLSIQQVFGIVNKADVVVGIDSMVVHVAGVLRKPTYGIFGSIDPQIRLASYNHDYITPDSFKMCGRQHCWYAVCKGQWCLQTLHPWAITKGVGKLLKLNA